MGDGKPVLKPTLDIDDDIMRQHVESLQENSQKKLVGIDAAPTATDPLLDDGESGIVSGNLYWRDGNTIFVFTADSTITIT